MTAGAWQRIESLDKDATALRPAVTIAWAASRESDSCSLWLDLFEGTEGRRAVVAPIGRLDREGCSRLDRAFDQARNYQARSLLLDLSRVHHVDYRGIGLLVRTIESSLAEGCEIRLEGVTKYVREIFRAAGVDLVSFGESGAGAACGTAPIPARGRTSALHDRTGAGLGLAAGPGGAE